MQQDLLLKCKPLVDYWKASVVHDNAAYNLSVNLDTFLLAVDNAIMDNRSLPLVHPGFAFQEEVLLYNHCLNQLQHDIWQSSLCQKICSLVVRLKVLSLTKTVSVPRCACPVGTTGTKSAYGLYTKYWSSSSTETITTVWGGGGALLKMLGGCPTVLIPYLQLNKLVFNLF